MMAGAPDLLCFEGDWQAYEDRIYQAFLESLVYATVSFRGWRVNARRHPETKGKSYGFWHVISEAPQSNNRNEGERIPNLRRCERIRWIAWAIEQADKGADDFSWWENRRGREVSVVIWAERLDFVVVLARRREYYLLKTAFCELKPHRRESFKRERAAFYQAQKD